MYSRFLWQIAKGKSRLIIKRRRWRTSRTRQISTQSLKLCEHIHQNLSLSRLNDHNSLQHTSQRSIARGRSRWRINSGCGIDILLSCRVTRSRRLRCSTCRRLDLRAFRANSHLSSSLPKECDTYGSKIWTGSDAGKSSKPKCNKILWMKIGWKRAWATAELLWTSFKEQKNRWGKLIEAPEIRAYKNTHRSIGMVWRWEIGHKEWHAILKKR